MKRLLGILLLGSALAACGGDDGGGSGVDADKQLSEVSAEESADLCGYLEAQVDLGAYHQAYCRIQGIAAVAQDPSGDCEAVTDECLADTDAIDPPVDCTDADPAEFSACTDVTVGDLEACLDATADQFDDLADAVTCETTIEELEEMSALPEACVTIEAACDDGSARELDETSRPFSAGRDLATLR